MRKLLLIALVLVSCQKQVIKPELPKVSAQSFTQIPVSQVNIDMYIEGVKTDKAVISFDPASLAIYQRLNPVADAVYFFSPYSLANFVSLSSDGIPLAVNRRPLKSNDTIPLRIYARKSGNYRFKVTSYNAPYKMCILDNGWKCNLDSGFTVDVADSSTFYNRFKFIVK